MHSSKEGHLISKKTKEEGSHYGSLLDRRYGGPDLAAGSKEKNKTRPKNVGTAFARIFGSGDTIQHKTCCCLFSQVATNFLKFQLQQIHLLFGQIHFVIWTNTFDISITTKTFGYLDNYILTFQFNNKYICYLDKYLL